MCLYDFRHTYISQTILDGVTILEVARLTGTSVQVIQRYYGHLVQQDSLRERLAKAQMSWWPPRKRRTCNAAIVML